ncbi:Nudix hydrolase 9 [Rhynchospora pubera]|uniref:Nudix hydrolase 9 n=1 Tax=Rhynchospora pubera TaxID=906938 RepID=A0AAV8GNE2_9POAL|nr:Nudix hydrolase 9 [Rhynchospora pubera]
MIRFGNINGLPKACLQFVPCGALSLSLSKSKILLLSSSIKLRMASTVCNKSTATEDPGTAFSLLLSCPSGLPPSRVSVDFGRSFDRIPHPDATLESSIKEIWDQRLEKNPSLYNGTKFRYGGFSLSDSSTVRTDCSICLHLGLTDYRTFVGTNLNPLWEKFLVSSEDDTVKCQHMANPLGNAAIVETSDKKILVLQRSHNVGEFPGYYVFPGGHSEPQVIGISSHLTNTDSSGSAALNEVVSKEMFDGIIREVVEEIGVPADSLTETIFIGVSQRVMNVRPTAFFFVRCNLDSTKIHGLYSKAQDGYESTHLFSVSMEELERMTLRMPGCHCGGHALYKLMKTHKQ